MYFNVIISYYFTTAIPPLPRLQKKRWLQTCRPPFWIYYLINLSSLRHIAVHTLSMLALWLWCNKLIQLLSFKYDPKSAVASWNGTSSCLLPSHLANPHGQLRMHIASFNEPLKISLTLHMWRVVKTLAYTTGTTSEHQMATWLELYPKSIVFLRIVAWHMRVFSRLLNVWGYGARMLRCYQKQWKNEFLLRILKLPRTEIWRPRNP